MDVIFMPVHSVRERDEIDRLTDILYKGTDGWMGR